MIVHANSYFDGAREGVDERAFFPEASGTDGSLTDSYQRYLTVESYKGYSHTQFQSLTDSAKQQQQEEQHCFILGTDFKSPGLVKTEKNAVVQKPLHQFFGEWPPKNTDSWLDLASNSRLRPTGMFISLTQSSNYVLQFIFYFKKKFPWCR